MAVLSSVLVKYYGVGKTYSHIPRAHLHFPGRLAFGKTSISTTPWYFLVRVMVVLTVLLWRVGALIRKHYGRPLDLTPLQCKLPVWGAAWFGILCIDFPRINDPSFPKGMGAPGGVNVLALGRDVSLEVLRSDMTRCSLGSASARPTSRPGGRGRTRQGHRRGRLHRRACGRPRTSQIAGRAARRRHRRRHDRGGRRGAVEAPRRRR